MAKRQDLVGKRFGRLTVLEYSHSKKYKNQTTVYWKCLCDCGNECVVSAQKLRSGHTKSCGCYRSEIAKRHEDLTGKRFGRLVVLEEAERNKSGDIMWLCKCDCGNTTIVRGSSLKNGDTKSCGCLAKEKQYEVHKKYNNYFVSGDIVYCKCSNGKYFIIDLDDLNKIKDYCWHVDRNGYVDTKVGDKGIRLHRLIMDCPNDKIVDHINRNPSDNRKSNLRIADYHINARNVSVGTNNTSGYLGVSFHKQTQKWRAFVTVNAKTVHLGLFENIEDAIEARKKGEIEYYGEEIA